METKDILKKLREDNNLTQDQYDAVYESLASGEIKLDAGSVDSVKDIITVNLTFK